MPDLFQSIDTRGVATLTLNRPARHNAFDDGLAAQLTMALRSLAAAGDVRLVVMRAAGPSFSAGADIGWLERMSHAPFDENLADANALAELMHCLDRLPKPTVAVVHGAAYGGGVGLAVCCDIALATESASFSLSEAKLGIIPAVIGPYVTRAIGARQARRLMLTAETVSAVRARARARSRSRARGRGGCIAREISRRFVALRPGSAGASKSLCRLVRRSPHRRAPGARVGAPSCRVARTRRRGAKDCAPLSKSAGLIGAGQGANGDVSQAPHR